MRYYYYSIIGKTVTGEDFMKVVCIENAYGNIKGSNDYFTEAINYVIDKYNVCILNISVLFGSKSKYTNMVNVDYLERG